MADSGGGVLSETALPGSSAGAVDRVDARILVVSDDALSRAGPAA
jgi:hypothetical protein